MHERQPTNCYTEPQMSEAFDRVADQSDWRAPIDCTIECCSIEIALIAFAIEFYTATTPTVSPVMRENFDRFSYRFEATGYRNGPAGS